MKRLVLALASVFVASAAHAAPITVGFFQGGFESGGFVAGFFVAEDFNRDGRISYSNFFGEGPFCEHGQPPCELLDYHMSFIRNSQVVFAHHGLSSFGPTTLLDSTAHFWGVDFPIGSSTLPVGNWLPEGCNFFDQANPCTSLPDGFIASHGPDTGNFTVWHGGLFFDQFHNNFCADFEPQCGEIGNFSFWDADTTIERIRIFAIPEPHPLTLIGIALIGLAFIRRRAMSIA